MEGGWGRLELALWIPLGTRTGRVRPGPVKSTARSATGHTMVSEPSRPSKLVWFNLASSFLWAFLAVQLWYAHLPSLAIVAFLVSSLNTRIAIAVTRQDCFPAGPVVQLTDARTTTETVAEGRAALVLCGGGPKGAYQLGCIGALLDRGTQIGMIAGSSIGAINGALLLSAGLEDATRIFLENSGRVFGLSGSGFLIGLLRIYSLAARQFSCVPRERRLRTAVAFLLWTIGLYLFYAEDLGSTSSLFLFAAAVFCFANLIPLCLSGAIWLACEHWELTVFSNRRLYRLLKKHIDATRLSNSKVRLIVTLSRETEIFDPANPSGFTFWTPPEPRASYVPEYRDVTNAAPGVLERCLLATASLPLGFLKPVQLEGHRYVDGGFTDNAPIRPVLEAGYREIFVIYTNHQGIVNGRRLTEIAKLAEHLSAAKRLLLLAAKTKKLLADYVARHGRRARWSLVLPKDDSWLRKLPAEAFDARIVHLVPSEPTGSLLGWLVRGDQARAKRLIELGYSDTMRLVGGERERPCGFSSSG